ncbi:TPA: replication endonuclease [Cronobacter sakazakii]|nr:replication endonuclease [Cronobacter sakazakii]KAB0859420.1 replication endonuclease [Cronobacter sakazakii]HAU5496362.1 replication endonuclease [Cronobacter sakazakii]
MPDWLAGYFGQRYEALFNGRDGRRRANTFLRQTIGQNVLPRLRKVSARYRMRADESDLPFGKALARLPSLDRREVKELAAKVASWMAQSFYEFTDTLKGKPKDEKEMCQRTADAYIRLSELTLFIGFTAPYWTTFTANKLTTRQAESGLLRMMAPAWWYTKIKRARDVQREHMAIAVGQVQKAASAYVSRGALHEWTEQKRRDAEFFRKFDLMNKDGDRVSMADMVYGSVSNPAVRRCELMVRMRGFEDIASEKGMVGDFYTITAPSRYHSVHSKGGFVSQWNGCNPQDTQRYLCGVWAKARAALSRAGIHVFGFRVVEPHHDGTPHWHMLLFMRPQDVDAVRDIICYHARITDSEELNTPEALKARFFVEPIDPEIGSATGYIAKYISKNIDGFALDGEKDSETGESLRDMAKAVSAWASRWRIRQFQQIGGAPVTVWRELRRLRGQQLADPHMDAVLAAADIASDWASYTELQGGPLVARRDLVVRLAYEITEQGNEYGEDVQRVQGIYSPHVQGSEVATRLVKWAIVPKLAEASAEAGFSGGAAAPWSSVNNCTGGTRRRLKIELQKRGFDGSDLEIDALLRGSSLALGYGRALIYRNGVLRERHPQPENESWPGWG